MQAVKKIKTREEVQKIIGKNIRNKCQKDNINIMDLSEEVGMSYEYMRHIVSKGGKKGLSFYSMYKIALALDMSMDDLCTGLIDNK